MHDKKVSGLIVLIISLKCCVKKAGVEKFELYGLRHLLARIWYVDGVFMKRILGDIRGHAKDIRGGMPIAIQRYHFKCIN